MSIPVDKVVSTTVQISPTFPQSQVGLGVLLIIGNSARLPIGERIRFYDDLDAVGEDFSTTDPEYVLAQAAFSQSPAPSTIAIGRRFTAPVAGELLGGLSADKVLADYTGIVNGSLDLTIDGTPIAATAINLTGAATLNAVATAIQGALAALQAGVTVVYDGSRFIVRSGTTGAASSVGFATPSGVGTDLAPMLALRAADGAISTAGAGTETVATSLDAIQAVNPKWYGFTFVSGTSDADIEAAAAWAESHMKMFGYVSSNGDIPAIGSTTDLASVLSAAKYRRTIGQWDPNGGSGIASIMANLFTTDFTQPNSSKTLKFKLEPGITPANITETQREVLEDKQINYYTVFGDSAMFSPGVTASGAFADEVYALDSLQNDLQINVFGYVYTRPTKIPQTDAGVASIVQVIERVCQQYVRNGTLAPGIWNGQPLGQKNTGDFLEKGFYVFALPVAQQLPSDRSARKAPPITIIATGAGAIHNIAINIIFQQ
jgi:hypothetical protein